MLLDSGIATIWRGVNSAPPGGKPSVSYTQMLWRSYYGEKTVGINRYYTAKAHDDRADLLIEMQRCPDISTADRCAVESYGSGGVARYYKILMVQHITDECGLPATDLTLERIDSIDAP